MSGAQSGGGVPFGPPPALCEHNNRPRKLFMPVSGTPHLAVKLPWQLRGDGAPGRVAARTLCRYQQYLYISIA